MRWVEGAWEKVVWAARVAFVEIRGSLLPFVQTTIDVVFRLSQRLVPWMFAAVFLGYLLSLGGYFFAVMSDSPETTQDAWAKASLLLLAGWAGSKLVLWLSRRMK